MLAFRVNALVFVVVDVVIRLLTPTVLFQTVNAIAVVKIGTMLE